VLVLGAGVVQNKNEHLLLFGVHEVLNSKDGTKEHQLRLILSIKEGVSHHLF
jgi:hypothetical protein